MSAWIMGKVKPTHSHLVVPLADHEPSPVVPGPPINMPSVAAEVVVHCENSIRPRAPASTVVEKIQDIDRDEPSSGSLPKQPEKKTIPSPQQHVIVETQGLESREAILYPSSPTHEVTH